MADRGGKRAPRFKCLACGRYRVRGMFIRRFFLCQACEARLLATDVSSPEYGRFIDRFHQLWPEFARRR